MLNKTTFKGSIVATTIIIGFLTMSMLGFKIWIGFPVMNLPYIPPFFEVLFEICAIISAIILFGAFMFYFSKTIDVIGAILGTVLINVLKTTHKISVRLKLIKQQ